MQDYRLAMSFTKHVYIVWLTLIFGILTACSRQDPVFPSPAADHHVHIQSQAAALQMQKIGRYFKEDPPDVPIERTATDALAALDVAGIQKAAVLSAAYLFGVEGLKTDREEQEVTRENQWTAQQLAGHTTRLYGFCSLNPLKEYAIEELDRCKSFGLIGLKMHFGNAGINLSDTKQLAKLRTVFARANELRFPLIIHLRTIDGYGGPAVATFLHEVLPTAPDVPVQIAHLGGWGGYDRTTDEALRVFARTCTDEPELCKNLFFDISGIVLPKSAAAGPPSSLFRQLADGEFPDGRHQVSLHIRQLGIQRFVFASDWPYMKPREYLAGLRDGLELTPGELKQLLSNTMPYLK